MFPPLNPSLHSPSSLYFLHHNPTPLPPTSLPYILLLHGHLSTHLDQLSLSETLTPLHAPLLLLDLPYHTNSSSLHPSTLSEAAKLIAHVLSSHLKATTASPAHLVIVGYSLGGRLGFQIARELTSTQWNLIVDGVVMISAAPPPNTELEVAERRVAGHRVAAEIEALEGREEDFRNWLQTRYSGKMWGKLKEMENYEELLERRVKGFDVTVGAEVAAAASAFGKYDGICNDVLEVPGLYVYGTRDVKYKAFQERVCGLFGGGGRAVEVEGAGHNVVEEKPEVLGGILRGWLRELIGGGVRIGRVSMKRYELEMKKVMVVGGVKVGVRKGFLVSVESVEGVMGVGDVCPLPGLHEVDVEDCVEEVKDVRVVLEEIVFYREGFSVGKVEGILSRVSGVVRMGVVCAVLHMLVKVWRVSLGDVIGGVEGVLGRLDEVRLNGVLPRMKLVNEDEKWGQDRADLIRTYMRESRFDTIKVKVGASRHPAEDGEYLCNAAYEARLHGRRLRLDANREWTRTQFDEFRSSVSQIVGDIEFIEEPLVSKEELKAYLMDHDIHQVEDVSRSNILGIGLDESLTDTPLEMLRELASSLHCKALVIKPAVVGSMCRILELSKVAFESDCKVVMSTVFDSGVGIAWTAILASILGEEETCHGIGTFEYLSSDVVKDGFEECCVCKISMRVSTERCWWFLDKIAEGAMMSEDGTLGRY